MKLLTSAILAVSLLTTSTAFAQGDKDVAEARAATEHWMKLMDTEEYSAAWNNGSGGMRKEISKFTWSMIANAMHLPLGDFKSRTFKAAHIKQGTAGKPDSVSFDYVAHYTKSPNVTETVTVIHEADGVWRVSGYTINNDNK